MTENGQAKKMRINRYLAQCGLGSRRQCDRLVEEGRIRVNGKTVASLGMRVIPGQDVVEYRGKKLSPVETIEYVAYHKERGTVVTALDPEGRPTIYDALAETGRRYDELRYVGRLDLDSEGLLLLTNDGDLVHRLTHPRYHVKKSYRVQIDKPLSDEHARVMVDEGVVSEGQRLHAGAVRPVSGAPVREHWYGVDLYEGKKRQIRRIFDGLGYRVIRLIRLQFGVVKLDGLLPGEVRPLTEREVAGLKKLGW
jgi:pseudouridine synthase